MSFDDFKRRASTAALVPVWKDCLLDTETPVSAFAKLRRGPFAFLLESAPAGGETWSRYTYLGTEPRSAWRLTNGVVEDWTIERGWHNARRPTDPLADLATLIDEANPANVPELGQFWGGVVGYFGYDVVRLIERLPNRPANGLGLPDAILKAPRRLTEEEYAIVKRHPEFGHSLLDGLGIEPVEDWVLHHHEHWDGSGYPEGLAGEEIPLGARVILVADAFEAITADRPYRPAQSEEAALAELRDNAGSQFDPAVVQALEQHLAGADASPVEAFG